MDLMLRPVLKTTSLALLLTLAAAAHALATDVRVRPAVEARVAQTAPGAKPTASVKVRTCRSSAYYVGREITFRAKMARYSETNSPQHLQIKVDVLQRLNEAKKFKKLKAKGLGEWTSSSDVATIYQRDLTLTNVETAAAYKARVAYRWTASDGKVEHRRTITSRICKQKVGLPRVGIVASSSVSIPGSTDVNHTITLSNTGKSEMIDFKLLVRVDDALGGIATVGSIGPKQTLDVQVQAPGCKVGAAAYIPRYQNSNASRPVLLVSQPFVLTPCR